MTEQERAKNYVLGQLGRNREFRLRLSELFLGKSTEVDAEYLFTVLKVAWSSMGDSEKLYLSQAIAGTNHYNAFIQFMDAESIK